MFRRNYNRISPYLILVLAVASISFSRNLEAKEFKRVVSLVPAATEIFEKLGISDVIVGITVHDLKAGMHNKKVVGSFFAPDIEAINKLNPDLIIISSIHEHIKSRFSNFTTVNTFNVTSLDSLYEYVRFIGKSFRKEQEAENIIKDIQEQIHLISKKISKIPVNKRKRVLRFMGRSTSPSVYIPAGNSFQNDMIELAGGIPLRIGNGDGIVPISLDDWKRFNPQVIYGCGEDRQVAEKFFSRPGWKDVDAIKNGEIHYFPCSLTCRLSVNTGLFVQWLSSVIYDDEFSKPENLILPEKVLGYRNIKIDLEYIDKARVVESRIMDFPHKTLEIELKKPMDIISTLEGPRKEIKVVGNSYSPPPCWKMSHRLGFLHMRKHTYDILNLSPSSTSLLFTGADMDNLSIQRKSYGSMVVYALVTAGVRGNALRMSMDEGRYIEPGTINIILLTNRKLSPRAMARAIITITEAKTAALEDLDIRSTQNPAFWQATGTGTDEIIVVSGVGSEATLTGGHAKLGQLIAEAVYDGVVDAISKQNRLVSPRSIFERLEERRIELYGLASNCGCMTNREKRDFLKHLQMLLTKPEYASYIEMAFAISDAYEHHLISDLTPFKKFCLNVASEIANRNIGVDEIVEYVPSNYPAPEPLKIILNAIINGIALKKTE